MTGLITTVLILTTITFYSSVQLLRLVQNGETLVTLSMRDTYFEDDFVMSSEEHKLKFAFALTAYDENVEYEDESEYGSISAKYATWGIVGHSYSDIDIPIRKCTAEELGIVEG